MDGDIHNGWMARKRSMDRLMDERYINGRIEIYMMAGWMDRNIGGLIDGWKNILMDG